VRDFRGAILLSSGPGDPRAKTHGFLVRSKSTSGKKVLARRRRKGRAKLAVKKSK
jgi:large subunit ribosomal protein L34